MGLLRAADQFCVDCAAIPEEQDSGPHHRHVEASVEGLSLVIQWSCQFFGFHISYAAIASDSCQIAETYLIPISLSFRPLYCHSQCAEETVRLHPELQLLPSMVILVLAEVVGNHTLEAFGVFV